MQTYTVTGLVDEESRELFVAGVQAGRHDPADTSRSTRIPGYGNLYRFTGYFEAGSADEAERIAIDIVRHYTDEDSFQWNPGAGRTFRYIETIETGEEL